MAEERLVFDTNVLWHGLLPSDDPVAPTCKRLVQAVDEGEIRAYSSTLSLVELAKVITPQMPMERLSALTETLRQSKIVWVALSEPIAMRARDLALERGLAPAYDAVILATAIEIRARSLYTYDRDDFPVGQTISGVQVSEPTLPPRLTQGRLELEEPASRIEDEAE